MGSDPIYGVRLRHIPATRRRSSGSRLGRWTWTARRPARSSNWKSPAACAADASGVDEQLPKLAVNGAPVQRAVLVGHGEAMRAGIDVCGTEAALGLGSQRGELDRRARLARKHEERRGRVRHDRPYRIGIDRVEHVEARKARRRTDRRAEHFRRVRAIGRAARD